MKPLRVGIIGFDGLDALDLVGPAEAFATARAEEANRSSTNAYQVMVIGLSPRPFVAESGVVFQPHTTLQSAPKLDTIIVPGGRGLRRPEVNRAVAMWLKTRARQTRRIVSVCTGIYGLAASGLLAGRRVTTHWRFAADAARRFPQLRFEPNAIFLKDGKFYTSAGVTAGIDLALALIEEDLGSAVALTVARELVVYLKRSGGQEQYSEPLQFQTEATDRLTGLAGWIASNPNRDLSVRALARRACLSPRHFARRFKSAFGQPPGVFVQDHRLDEARRRLVAANLSIDAIATSVGFKSADAFRRAFQHRFRVTPGRYRHRFGAGNGHQGNRTASPKSKKRNKEDRDE
jgi:transcriptional regulator GlxA family with amidase domain